MSKKQIYKIYLFFRSSLESSEKDRNAKRLKGLAVSQFATIELVDPPCPDFQQGVEYNGYFNNNRCGVLELGGVDVQDVDDIIHGALWFCIHLIRVDNSCFLTKGSDNNVSCYLSFS